MPEVWRPPERGSECSGRCSPALPPLTLSGRLSLARFFYLDSNQEEMVTCGAACARLLGMQFRPSRSGDDCDAPASRRRSHCANTAAESRRTLVVPIAIIIAIAVNSTRLINVAAQDDALCTPEICRDESCLVDAQEFLICCCDSTCEQNGDCCSNYEVGDDWCYA